MGKNIAGINGIAVSALETNYEQVYYTAFSSFQLYSVNTATLKVIRTGTTALSDAQVQFHGNRLSQGGGMIMDSWSQLFYAVTSQCAVNNWNFWLEQINSKNELQYIQSNEDLEWPETFTFDNIGNLLVVSNKVNLFNVNKLKANRVNFRVLRFPTGTRSYMYQRKDS